MAPQSWIRLPPFFASIVPQWEPLELWPQHAGCSTLATEAEVAVVAPGEVFTTRGWSEIARVCRTRGAFAVHLEYDGASVMFFKVFDANGRRLECCPGRGGRDPATARTRPADRSLGGSSGGGGVGGSSDSGELYATPEMSDVATSPRVGAAPGAGRARQAVAASDPDGVGTGAGRPTVDDGVFCRDARSLCPFRIWSLRGIKNASRGGL